MLPLALCPREYFSILADTFMETIEGNFHTNKGSPNNTVQEKANRLRNRKLLINFRSDIWQLHHT
jgi:hypothetical protein